MEKIYILCEHYLEPNEMSRLNIGGIETYLYNLIPILIEKDLYPIVIQFSNIDKIVKFEKYETHGADVSKLKKWKFKKRLLIRMFETEASQDDYVLYATEDLVCKRIKNPSIVIQHGISWDKPLKKEHYLKNFLIAWYGNIRRLNMIKNPDMVVCVDYNYVNWHRTIDLKRKVEFKVIPNFSSVPSFIEKDENGISIIFARRLVEYRGTRLFVSAIKNILNEFNNVSVCIAGDGPDSKWIREELNEYKNVEFITYQQNDSIDIHQKYTIAVVPTLGSEGTSLSLLEAMASSCAVIATNVGGITNIILDGFNGLIVNPNSTEIYQAIKRLINDISLRSDLSKNAYYTVKKAFSYDAWRGKWVEVIEQIKKHDRNQVAK